MALLDESKWLTAQEALEWGFVDEIVDQPEEDAPEVTKAMAKKFNAVGLPLAGLEIQNESLSSRILHEVLDAIRALSSKLDSRATEVTNHNTEPSMKKFINFVALAMALAMDKLECEEGGTCQLTDEQLGALDSKMNELTSQHDADQQAIAERDTTIAELREQVANLQKAPGEETTKVDETTGEEAPAATTSKDLYDSIKDII
jgi:enoyl-CoA hydratase/carnithine racemase